jgi:HD superfamily phosphodiesterase
VSTSREALLQAMEAYFGKDTKRINHARRVTSYAEKLMGLEGGDYPVVIGAAVLHDIGIHEAERKHGSTGGKFQEIEGPPIARDILLRLGYDEKTIEEICEIIAHHHSPGKINTVNFKVLYDADWLVNLGDEYDIRDKKKLATIVDAVFLTASGRNIARETYLKS